MVDVGSITVTATASHVHATITVNEKAVLSGQSSQAIALEPGETTTITIVVTAEDGKTKETYTIIVDLPQPPAGIRIRSKIFLEGPLQ